MSPNTLRCGVLTVMFTPTRGNGAALLLKLAMRDPILVGLMHADVSLADDDWQATNTMRIHPSLH